MAPADLGNLVGPDEYALDLGGLVCAAHPALEAHIGAPAGRPAGQRRGEVADCKPDPGMMRGELWRMKIETTRRPPGLTSSRTRPRCQLTLRINTGCYGGFMGIEDR